MITNGAPSKRRYPVLVVGGGSVGLSLAAELGWRGIECLVVEERDSLNDHPRANAIANRTMEYYRRWGIDQAITDAGIPPSLPAEYLWVTSLHGRELHRVSLPPFTELVRSHAAGGYAEDEHNWSPYLKTIAGQDEVEKVLLDFVSAQETVEFHFTQRLIDFVDDGTTVTCQLEDVETGRRHTVETDYLVACDGGRSSIRRGLGIDYEGTAGLASFVSIYFHAPEMIEHHPFGHGNIYFPLHRDHRGFLLTWDDDRTYTYHLILADGQQWSEVDPIDAVRALVGADFEITVRSVQPWDAHALVAKSYSTGRTFLAGDAAHLFSPTGGFGMNTGVSDAIDLAWKLEAALDGWAGPELLPSYDRERRPVGRRNTDEAADCFDRLFAVMQEGDLLDADGPEGDAVRQHLIADIEDQQKLISSSGTLLGYRYEGSNIVEPDGTLEPPDDARRYLPIARPGHRAPHVWLDDGSALYDRLGPHFTLLQLEPQRRDVSAFVAAADAIGLPLKVVHVAETIVRDIYDADLVLIRPDLMVGWRSDAMPADPERILDVLRGAGSR